MSSTSVSSCSMDEIAVNRTRRRSNRYTRAKTTRGPSHETKARSYERAGRADDQGFVLPSGGVGARRHGSEARIHALSHNAGGFRPSRPGRLDSPPLGVSRRSWRGAGRRRMIASARARPLGSESQSRNSTLTHGGPSFRSAPHPMSTGVSPRRRGGGDQPCPSAGESVVPVRDRSAQWSSLASKDALGL